MGDELFESVMVPMYDLELLERLYLNFNRNCLSPEVLASCFKELESLKSLHYLEIEAKRNIKKVEERDMVRNAVASLPFKQKKADF